MADVVTIWNPFLITNNGLNLRQQAIATGVTVTFHYAKIGQGVPSNPTNIPLMTDLVLSAQQVPVVRSESSGATHYVGVKIDNLTFSQPILMREIGLFASMDGGTPILYGYTYATQGYDSIPAGSVSHYIWTVGIDTVLSRTQNISFTYDGSKVYATYDDIDQLIQAFDETKTQLNKIIDTHTKEENPHGLKVLRENIDTILKKIEDLEENTVKKEFFVIADTMPIDQPIGGVWFDTSDGPSDSCESSIIIGNVVVSETEPEDTSLIWLQTEPS